MHVEVPFSVKTFMYDSYSVPLKGVPIYKTLPRPHMVRDGSGMLRNWLYFQE